MPVFINHHRNYSWPPTVHLLDLTLLSPSAKHKTVATSLPDIDEDPFAHFISPINEEDDPYDVLSLSAGILPGELPTTNSKADRFKASVAKKWARYWARNLQLPQIEPEEQQKPLDVPHIETPPDSPEQYWDEFGRPYKVVVREPTRGRAQDLLTPEAKRRRLTRRTLSGHRHSWREPSPELFTVSEEEELSSSTENRGVKTNDGGSRRSERMEVTDTTREKAKL
jgi:hypothetical protein